MNIESKYVVRKCLRKLASPFMLWHSDPDLCEDEIAHKNMEETKRYNTCFLLLK